MAEIQIRPYRDADLQAVLALLSQALGESSLLARTPEWFWWKHRDNPFGPSLALVAESEGQIVGLRAFMRWELNTADGNSIRCVRAVDTATHPDYLRRGIFKGLTTQGLEMAEADGVDLVFNTPNSKSKPGYLKMGWEEVGPIKVLVRPHPSRLAQPAQTGLPDPDEYIEGSLPEPTDLADREPRGLRTPRTINYLRWRFSQHPTARYIRVDNGEGAAIVRPNVRSGRRELVISELMGDARGAVRKVVKTSRAGYEVAFFSPGSPERRAVTSAGLFPLPVLTALTLVVRPLRKLSFDVTDMSSWDLSLGDLELL